MDISLIICSYNRSRALATALDCVARLEVLPPKEWEVIVVDNNSPDDTHEVVNRFSQAHPGRFRYLFEPRPGKSNALNTGIADARGRILAFLDDDVTVGPEWLERLTAPLFTGKWCGVGGRILPQWDQWKPSWLAATEKYLSGPLVCFDLGTEPAPLQEPPFGTNMAFCREVFERHGGFRADLGPGPESKRIGEDSEFANRLLNAGEPMLYEPSAVVLHPVTPERLKKGYYLEWWCGKGQVEVRTEGRPPVLGPSVKGVPLILLRRLVRHSLQWIASVGEARRFMRKLAVWYI
jgi:glucosyl-dolichyl phosphate glucuronosyltransferase